ncbi:9163_t:CDS:1, partial [Ambispora leptoticha]
SFQYNLNLNLNCNEVDPTPNSKFLILSKILISELYINMITI